jgi:diguanylate cyclase (GGDEF)-like protein
MAHTIFILGTDSHKCKELKEILEEKTGDQIVTASDDDLPNVRKSETVILTSEEKNTRTLYQRLLNKLEEQVHRAELQSQLIHLFSCSLPIGELLERVVAISTEVLGDSAFIVLADHADSMKLEAAYSKDSDSLVKMLIATVNLGAEAIRRDLLSDVLMRRQSVLISDLQQVTVTGEMKAFVEKHSLVSLLAVPIQTKDSVLGALVSLSTDSNCFNRDDTSTASALADFTAIALENAGLFAELQRTVITDSLTGVYNTRFFHEVLARETARGDRFATPLALLMIDIDAFKLVNDTFGHVIGNKVLTEIARTIENTVRNTDFVFRCGGDEFGVVLPGTHIDGALRVAEKILQQVGETDILGSMGYNGTVTVSVGLSEYRRGSHFETLVAEADRALYDCKRSSKNCARVFKPSPS